ncbi:hypothetical protein [Synechococcus sp. RS9902]|uniref:hypothetical protein n=1 Tax=Synechococcus sp. RS9902 TaxID=221345 RepID=UPI001648E989|nr:hypothetical protein [Synechococcus sp. RS9902]QNI96552.1 stf0 sulfotransferase family protein [Synechococcus sp. RS9902]
MAPIQLIHSEQQFAHLRPTMERYAGCVDPAQWPMLSKPLILILTTQRTGSTLLCQDIASAWQLPYQPTESFIPPLTGIFNNGIPPQDLHQQLANTLKQHNQASCSVFKLMADYIGWLGFFCTPKQQALSASYTELSARFLQLIQTHSPEGFHLIQLKRKHKLKQAISRLFNSMGLPTHISSDDDQKSFDTNLVEKLAAYPQLELMVIDQLRIILSQCHLLEVTLNKTTRIDCNISLEYEHDLCKNADTYLNSISKQMGFKVDSIQRQLRRTSGSVSRDLLQRTLHILGLGELEEIDLQPSEQEISVGQ